MVIVKRSQILIRYGEIGLKAEYTRRQFTRQLKNNLMYAFSVDNISVKIEMMRGRFFIHTADIERSIQVVKKIFGIVSFSPVWESTSEVYVLTKDALELMRSRLDEKTSFALRVRRSGNHNFTSQEAAIRVGKAVVDTYHSPVDLENPDVELFIEIRDDKSYLFFDKIDGVGGLPYATQGNICCVVQTKYDILASWYLMKRGCNITYYISDRKIKGIIKEFLKKWYIKQKPKTIIESADDFTDVNTESITSSYQAICSGTTFSD